jgi:PAS domain S-box-containing protein
LTLAIRVLPAWWNTWQFRTVWITSLLLLTWFVYQFRVHQIQRQSKQLRDVIDTIPGYVWSALPDGSVDFINQRWLEFSGVSLEEALGRGWEAAVHPEDRARFVEVWRAAVESGKPMESEARVRGADGQYRWLLIRNVPLHDGRGRIVKWYGTSTDIDERKRAEEALRRLNRELRAISNCNQALLRATDERSLLEEICRIICEEAGYRIAWVAYAEHDEAKTVRPVAWAGAEEGYLATAGVTWADTERGRGPTGTAIRSGKTCYIQDFATDPRFAPWRDSALQHGFRSGIGLPLKDEHDNTFGGLTIHSSQPNAFTPEEIRLLEELAADLAFGIVTLRSQTAGKRAEEALRKSEAYLADGQRLTQTGSFAWSTAARQTTYWSEEQFRIFDLNPQDGLPSTETFWQRIHPEDLDQTRELLLTAAERTMEYEHDHRIVLPDGTVKHIHAIGHPVLDENGQLAGYVGTAVDVTERKHAEQERERLRQLEADLAHINRVSMLGELAASIAHEVNQPLSGVVSNGSACLRWLAAEVPNVEEARENARRIVRDGKRAGEVIARIRALAKRAATARERLDLNETIQDILALVADEAKKQSVIVRTQFAGDLSPALGDRVQLQQVILNLVMNAIEAMSSVADRARELVITTRNINSDQVQVTVEDSGTGIDPQKIDRIFDSFYTTKPGGMGMGLSISRSILQAHGGRLWATAKDGTGTSFHFTLPKYHEEEANAGVAAV